MLLWDGTISPGADGVYQGVCLSKTEKADDAQLKVGRCYLALEERDQAIAAFRKLLIEFSESEYVAVARKELKYLGGQ